MAQSLISTEIPDAIINNVNKHLQDIVTALQPYITGLSSDQRREVVKMGDKSVSYANKVKDYLGTSPDYLPRRFDISEFTKDYQIPQQLSPLRGLAEKIVEMLDDTITAAGSDVMQVCNAYYNSVQDAAHDGDAGAKAIYEDLKTRFPHVSRRSAAKG